MNKRKQRNDFKLYRVIALVVAVLLTGSLSGCFGEGLQLERPKVTFPVPSGPSMITQTTTGSSGPDTSLLPGVPEGLETNVYLGGRGKGDCQTMTGEVLLTVIFATDSESSWTEQRMNEVRTQIAAVEARIEADAAVWGAELDLLVEYTTGTATSGQLVLGDNKEWVGSVTKSAGLGSRTEVNQTLEANRGVAEAPVAIFVDRSGRSFANSSNSAKGAEYLICYEDADPLYHELNHVFGAKDFYYPQSVRDLADTYLTDSIMVQSETGNMEALTAYLIGWTDTLSAEALAFLQATANLTAEQLEEERDREQYTGYVTDFQKGDAIYTGYMVDGQLHGYGTRTKLNGDSYTGDWDHGVFHGTGTYTWADGDSYTGDWAEGVRHGNGTYTWADGSYYTGQFTEGKRTGQGTTVGADGAVYVGSYLDGKRNGRGTQTLASGDRYDGDWVEDSRHGHGTYTWAGGGSYAGDWVEGVRTGRGKYTASDGSVYEGDFLDGHFHGQGTYTFVSGDYYTGAWLSGKRNGYGIYQWTDGTRYEGQFLDGKRHGQGTLTYANGTVESGLWENGDFKG